ncbi:MAG TPA: hypothetical protein VF147_14035 [Vicinamibacterales bacterium]
MLPPDPHDEILAYLEAHPSAADSLEGIVSWWLPRQRYVEARDLIQRSLDRLVDSGRIVTTRLPDGTVLYRKPALEDAR